MIIWWCISEGINETNPERGQEDRFVHLLLNHSSFLNAWIS
jgi:hypothetical protein